MNTVIIKREAELFGIFSKYKLFINNKSVNIFYKKKILLPDGNYNFVIEKGFFKSNKISLKLEGGEYVTILVKGSPAGRYGRKASVVVIISSLFYLLSEYVFHVNYSVYFLLPFLLYMLMPVYTSIFERDKKRITLYVNNWNLLLFYNGNLRQRGISPLNLSHNRTW